MKYLAFVLSINLIASSFNLIQKKKRARRKREFTPKVETDFKALEAIERSKKKMANLLAQVDNSPVVVEEATLRLGSMIRGKLVNSIIASNSDSPVMIKLLDERILGSKLLCNAKRVSKRASLNCSTLSTPKKDIPIEAKILSTDGSLGLRGKYRSGNIGSSIIDGIKAFGAGVLGFSKSRVSSNRGNLIDESLKNQSIDGLGGVLNSGADDYLKNQVDDSESVEVAGGVEVLIYFNKEVKY